MELVKVQTTLDGKDIKLSPERHAKIAAAMSVTPKRIVQLIKAEIKVAGGELDEVTEDLLVRLFDVTKFRQELVDAAVIEKGGRGKKGKTTLKELFNK